MKNNVLKVLMFAILLSICSAFVMAGSDISVSPANIVTQKGDSFVLSININTRDLIRGAEFDVNFDPNLLEISSYQIGNFLTADGATVIDLSIFNNSAGIFEAVSLRNPSTGINGSGAIINVTFKVLARNGNSSILVSNVELANKDGIILNVTNVYNGAVTIVTKQGVVINEFMPNAASEWVELYNNESVPVNISGWRVNDSAAVKYTFSNTIIEPKNYFLLINSLGLDIDGDAISLYNEEGALVDSRSYSSSQLNKSIGRMHDGLNEWVTFDVPTPNATNNRLPIGEIATQTTNEDTPKSFLLPDYITDEDNDALAFTLVHENVNEVNCEINGANVTLEPAQYWNGIANCTVRVNDGFGTIDKLFFINVNAVNNAPVINLSLLNGISLNEDSIISDTNLSRYVADIDNTYDEIIWSCNSNVTDVIPSVDSLKKMLNITATNNFNGFARISCTASDSIATAADSFTVFVNPVNDAPVVDLSPLSGMDLDEDTEIENINLNNYVTDVDSPKESLEWNCYSNQTNATVAVDNVLKTLSISAKNNFFGIVNITCTAYDSENLGKGSFIIDVLSVNDPPVIKSSISPINFLEGESVTLNLRDYVSDIDNLPSEICWSASGTTNLLIYGNDMCSSATISTLSPTWYGTESFNATASDGQATDTKTVTVNVQSILSFSNLIVAIDGRDYPANNGDTVGPAHPDSQVSLKVRLNNNYEDINKWVETITITAKLDSAIDDEETTTRPFALDGTENSLEQAIFNRLPLIINEDKYNLTITARGVDYKQVTREVTWHLYLNYVTENREIRINKTTLIEPELSCYRETELETELVNSGETVQYVNLTLSNNELNIHNSKIVIMDPKATVTETTPITINNTPAPGTYPINIMAEYDDGKGGYVTQSKSVNLKIDNCFNIEDKSMYENDAAGITIDLYDYVNDPVLSDSEFSYNITSETNVGVIDCTISGHIITCANPATYGYSDITVSVAKDSYTNYDSFRLTVKKVNSAPIAYDVEPEGNEDNPLQIILNCTDVDNDTLTYTKLEGPNHGVLSGSGSLRVYIPNADYYGSDSFSYRCNDGTNNSNTALVDITVHPVMDPPSITNATPEDNILIGDGISQNFGVTIVDPDQVHPSVNWYVNGELKQPGNSPYFSWESDTDFTVKAEISNATVNKEHTWYVDVSKVPVTSYSGTIQDVTEYNVNAFRNLTIYNSFVKIDFGDRPIDLSQVVDLDKSLRLEKGIAGIDTSVFNVFKVPATVTMYNLPYTSVPTIYYNQGFNVAGTQECPSSICTVINYTAGTLVFSVTTFNIYFVTPPSNQAPVITSTPITTADEDTLYSYDVDAFDANGDSLTYSLITKPSSDMVINPTTGLITWTPTTPGNYSVTVGVSDRSFTVTQSFSINVAASELGNVLDIRSVKVKPTTVKPGEDVTVEVKIKNKGNFDLQNIDLNVWFEDKDGNILEDDSNDDVEDSSNFDLGKGENEGDLSGSDTKFTFTMPIDVANGDEYYVHVEAEGTDEYGTIYRDVDQSESIRFKKEKHEIEIRRAELNPTVAECERTINLDVQFRNIGQKDEDVDLTIKNPTLHIDETESLTLDSDPDSDNNEFSKSYSFVIEGDVTEGSYNLELVAEYENGNKKATKNIPLDVKDCITTQAREEEQKVFETTVSPVVPSTSAVTTAPATISFTETSEYLTLLIIGIVLITGAIVFIIGSAIILARRR